MNFEWTGTDKAGEMRCGTIDAKSKTEAAAKVRAMGVYPDEIVGGEPTQSAKPTASPSVFSPARILWIAVATASLAGAVIAFAFYDVGVSTSGGARVVNMQRVGDRLAIMMLCLSIFIASATAASVSLLRK